MNALARYHGPVLVIGGEQDRSTLAVESRAMFAAVTGPRALWLVPTGDHLAICDLADPRYRAVIGKFLDTTIAGRVRSRPNQAPQDSSFSDGS